MNLIRKLKISKITNIPLDGIEGEIISFIEEWIKDLIPFKMDNNDIAIYYMKPDGRYVLESCSKTDYLWVRWDDFWKILEDKYEMKYSDIQIVIKYLVEETFKYKVKTPIYVGLKGAVEKAFKTKIKIPASIILSMVIWVEEAFKKS